MFSFDTLALLALCMEILDEVLQQIHTLLDLNLIHFEEVLQ